MAPNRHCCQDTASKVCNHQSYTTKLKIDAKKLNLDADLFDSKAAPDPYAMADTQTKGLLSSFVLTELVRD